jgi:hypothetical protein
MLSSWREPEGDLENGEFAFTMKAIADSPVSTDPKQDWFARKAVCIRESVGYQ